MEECCKVIYSFSFGLVSKFVLINSSFLFAFSYLKKTLKTEIFKSLFYDTNNKKGFSLIHHVKKRVTKNILNTKSLYEVRACESPGFFLIFKK